MIDIDSLLEVVEPDDVDVSSLSVHDKLNPALWVPVNGDYSLKPEIKQKLLDVANKFSEYIKYKGSKIVIKDIVITGSNANFNWSEYSDIDVHLMLDYKSISCEENLIDDFIYDKKVLWSLKHTIEISKIPVELYAQNSEEAFTKGSGVYSLISNEWIQKPNRKNIVIDFGKVKDKAAEIMNAIEEAQNEQQIEILRNKIWKMRSAGLSRYGEFSEGNYVYKVLRRAGVLQDLKNKYEEINRF